MNKIFYDKTRNLEIVDVSGMKSSEEIEASFGGGNYQSVEYDTKDEVVVYENDNPVVKARDEIRAIKEKAASDKKDAALSRLSGKFSTKDIDDLKILLF